MSATLRAIMLDPAAGWIARGTAAKVLATADARDAICTLLDLFFVQTEENDLWDTALAVELLGDTSAIPRLIHALRDDNLHRRRAAARALGWIWPVTKRAAKALVFALEDRTQPQPVREEAAESLAYSGYEKAVEPLIEVLQESDVRMRFWAVFALGGIGQQQRFSVDAGKKDAINPRIIDALRKMLPDKEIPPGNWWSVGREALAMLGDLDGESRLKVDSETERILSDGKAAPEELRWARAYSRTKVDQVASPPSAAESLPEEPRRDRRAEP
jgi:HEAT repeat protein